MKNFPLKRSREYSLFEHFLKVYIFLEIWELFKSKLKAFALSIKFSVKCGNFFREYSLLPFFKAQFFSLFRSFLIIKKYGISFRLCETTVLELFLLILFLELSWGKIIYEFLFFQRKFISSFSFSSSKFKLFF